MVTLDWAQLSKADLSQMAIISPRAVRAGGINPVGLQEGDSLSLRDRLYTALMASDNVAATALAEFVGARLPNKQGLAPISNFVSHMNALAHTLGMKRTLFLNPSGSDNVEGTFRIRRLPIWPGSPATPSRGGFCLFLSPRSPKPFTSFAAASTCPLNSTIPMNYSIARELTE